MNVMVRQIPFDEWYARDQEFVDVSPIIQGVFSRHQKRWRLIRYLKADGPNGTRSADWYDTAEAARQAVIDEAVRWEVG